MPLVAVPTGDKTTSSTGHVADHNAITDELRRLAALGGGVGATGPTGATGPVGATGATGAAGSGGSGFRLVNPGENIQTAIDVGPGVVFLMPGTHNRTTGLSMKKDVTLMGAGGGTRLVATSAMTRLIDVSAVDAIRYVIKDMVIDCNSLATIGIDNRVNFSGTSVDGEPDCMGRLDNLWVYDATDIGIRYGDVAGDVQNMITTRCRVRRAGNYGLWIGDASTITAADNIFSHIDVTTSNTTGAGFYVGVANSHFTLCKAWYCRNYGWHVKGTRNTFGQCESQDTRNHGWYIEWGKNVFSACVADSAAYYDVGGTVNGADGFYVVDGSNILSACHSFDRQQGASSQQRYGFNLPTAMSNYIDGARPGLGSRANALYGYDNATALFNWR